MKKRIIIVFSFLILLYFSDHYASTENNKAKWAEDFHFIQSEVERLHTDPYRVTSKEEFEARFETLLGRVNKLKDEEIVFEIASIISSLKDSHTSIAWDEYLTDQYYPVQFAIMDGKLYVVKATDDYQELLDQEVVTINGYGPNDIIKKIASYASYEDRALQQLWVENRLSYYDFYKNLGLSTESGAMFLFVKNDLENIYTQNILSIVSGDEVAEVKSGFTESNLPMSDHVTYIESPNRHVKIFISTNR
ncbi:MAG: hypothetical protein JXQ26_02155 [Tissierellales bacterium]|nr:hypothetical protein [Tissierellales bacterium]